MKNKLKYLFIVAAVTVAIVAMSIPAMATGNGW
jgi:hypothetical protein